jgi:hypothetical protein
MKMLKYLLNDDGRNEPQPYQRHPHPCLVLMKVTGHLQHLPQKEHILSDLF